MVSVSKFGCRVAQIKVGNDRTYLRFGRVQKSRNGEEFYADKSDYDALQI